MRALLAGESIEASLTYLPETRVASDNPFDLSGWRGGIAGLATMRASSNR